MSENKKILAIVGGGPSGLLAAHLAHQSKIGFQLFEKSDRLGGWIRSSIYCGKKTCFAARPTQFIKNQFVFFKRKMATFNGDFEEKKSSSSTRCERV